jgi:hypothetical protein
MEGFARVAHGKYFSNNNKIRQPFVSLHFLAIFLSNLFIEGTSDGHTWTSNGKLSKVMGQIQVILQATAYISSSFLYYILEINDDIYKEKNKLYIINEIMYKESFRNGFA